MIRSLTGSDLDVPRDENYLVCEWSDGRNRIVFSFCQKGDKAISAHIASGKRSLRKVKIAINEFCQWAFETMDWCSFIFALTDLSGIENVCKKCGFELLCERANIKALVRVRA